jgi:predicted lipoprotein with Yx(FWY)xxD motif
MGRVRIITALALTVLLAACGGGDDEAAADGPAISMGETDLGSVLVDSEGMTLYLFTPDAQGDPTCYDDCAANWPPLTESVSAGDGVDADLLGSVERSDGTTQITYNDWPLYYFANDATPGDVNGQGLNDVWFVVDAAGDAVS